MMKTMKLNSIDSKVMLSVNVYPCEQSIGIVVFSHGMAEYKERYEPFIHYLNTKGYQCVIHDHRGHGDSVNNDSELGYFYNGDPLAIVEDLKIVTDYIKKNISNISPLYMFSHSMGTLVARNYIKHYDLCIDKLILCGPPTRNNLARIGYPLAKAIKLTRGAKYKSKFIHSLTFSGFNKKFGKKGGNEWLSVNKINIASYNKNKKSGFMFTVDAFASMYKMLITSYQKDYKVSHPELAILMITGSEDPVIVSHQKFEETKRFLMGVGYHNVSTCVFNGLRHEILNENKNNEIFDTILAFFNEKIV